MPATLTTLINFTNANGAKPTDSLILDTQGNLLGTTQLGGASGFGTVFEIAKTSTGYASTSTILVSFNGTDAALPVPGLVADSAGNLFGTTFSGVFA